MKNILERFDEVLLTKASKVGLENITDTISLLIIIKQYIGTLATIEDLEKKSIRIDEINLLVKNKIIETNENMELLQTDISGKNL